MNMLLYIHHKVLLPPQVCHTMCFLNSYQMNNTADKSQIDKYKDQIMYLNACTHICMQLLS